jgi:hypothetical protein
MEVSDSKPAELASMVAAALIEKRISQKKVLIFLRSLVIQPVSNSDCSMLLSARSRRRGRV